MPTRDRGDDPESQESPERGVDERDRAHERHLQALKDALASAAALGGAGIPAGASHVSVAGTSSATTSRPRPQSRRRHSASISPRACELDQLALVAFGDLVERAGLGQRCLVGHDEQRDRPGPLGAEPAGVELDAAPGLDHTQDLALRSPGPGVRSVEAAAAFLDRRLVTPLVAAGRARRLAVRGPLVALDGGTQRGAREAPASHSLDLAGDERRLAGTARAHAGTFWGLRRGLAGAGSRSGRGSAGSRAGFVFGTSIGSTMIVRDGPGRVMTAGSPPLADS